MKKKVIYLFALVSFLSGSAIAQIEVEEEVTRSKGSSPTQGLFVKNGKQKLETLECYDFKSLILSYDMKPEYFNYDKITISLSIGNVESKTGAEYIYNIDKDDFYSLFNGKKYAYFKIFSSSDMAEKSKWRYVYDNDPLTRSALQHTIKKKNVDNSQLKILLRGGKITGSRTVHETRYDGTVVSKNVNEWKWVTVAEVIVPMKNRIKLGAMAILKGVPKLPKGNGNCYE